MRNTTPNTARSPRWRTPSSDIVDLRGDSLVGSAGDEEPHERCQPRSYALDCDDERQILVPIAEHTAAARVGPRQGGHRKRQADRHQGDGRSGGCALSGLVEGAPKEVELYPDGEKQQRDHRDDLLEERWTDPALAQLRQPPELLSNRHCGDFGLHLRVEDTHRVEVEEVVEGGGGDIASERADDERNHSPYSCPIGRFHRSSHPAE